MERPTIPAPRAIAPRPDALRVRGLLDGLAHELVRLVRRYGGSPRAERRAPRRCTCGKRRGQSHALACGMVLGEERRRAA